MLTDQEIGVVRLLPEQAFATPRVYFAESKVPKELEAQYEQCLETYVGIDGEDRCM